MRCFQYSLYYKFCVIFLLLCSFINQISANLYSRSTELIDIIDLFRGLFEVDQTKSETKTFQERYIGNIENEQNIMYKVDDTWFNFVIPYVDRVEDKKKDGCRTIRDSIMDAKNQDKSFEELGNTLSDLGNNYGWYVRTDRYLGGYGKTKYKCKAQTMFSCYSIYHYIVAIGPYSNWADTYVPKAIAETHDKNNNKKLDQCIMEQDQCCSGRPCT